MTNAVNLSAGILFSGGDAPGMNALLRAFVRLGHKRYDALVFGVKDGYVGLVRASRQLAARQWSSADRFRREVVDRAARDAVFDRSHSCLSRHSALLCASSRQRRRTTVGHPASRWIPTVDWL